MDKKEAIGRIIKAVNGEITKKEDFFKMPSEVIGDILDEYTLKQKIMSKSINRFLIEKGIKSNTQKITILQMVKWVDEWQEQVKNCSIPDVSDCKKLNIHECLNDLEKVIEVKTGLLDFIDKGSLRYQLKKAIDKMICCR